MLHALSWRNSLNDDKVPILSHGHWESAVSISKAFLAKFTTSLDRAPSLNAIKEAASCNEHPRRKNNNREVIASQMRMTALRKSSSAMQLARNGSAFVIVQCEQDVMC